MGRVRTNLVKRASRKIVEQYFNKLSLDFQVNKRVVEEVALTPSKKIRNKIAGFITHLMRRIQAGGQVRGISLKVQEEERERRLDFVPDVSYIDETIKNIIDVDEDTHAMLASIGFGKLKKVRKSDKVVQQRKRRFNKRRRQ